MVEHRQHRPRAGQLRRSRRAAWLQYLSFATVTLAVMALAVLAWQNVTAARDLERAHLQGSLQRSQERVRVLAQAAQMTAASARQAAVVQSLSSQTLQPILQSLVAAFQQRPELSYLGIAVAASGEYGYLERSDSGAIAMWLYPAPQRPQDGVRGMAYSAAGWRPLPGRAGGGYDPRTRPFYRAALPKRLSAGTWMPAYRWIPRDEDAVPVWGLSYVLAVRDASGELLGVVDADLHLPSLNRFLRALADEYDTQLQIVERGDTPQLLAGPDVQREPLPLPPALATRVAAGDGSAVVEGHDGRRLLAVHAIAPGPGLSWQLLASRPDTLWGAPLHQQVLQLALIGVLLAAGTVLVLARRRAERRLRHERDYADAMLEALPGVFHHYDHALRLRRWNRSLERVTGYSAQELRRMEAFDFVPQEQHAAVGEGIEQVFRTGAFSLQTDYLLKDGTRVPYLLTGVKLQLGGKPGFVCLGTDVSELKQAQQRVLYLATHDALTGLPNRNLLVERMLAASAAAGSRGGVVALLLLDLDGFKRANDGGGYAFGDALLKAVAARLRDSVGQQGLVARQGGDEFLLLLERLESAAQARQVAQRILADLALPMLADGRPVHLQASIGMSVFPQDGQSLETLIGHADIALYRAKALGGHQVQVFDRVMSEQAQQRVQLEEGLRTAVQEGQLQLHFQPKVDLADGRITGSEALLRWHHPQLGMVSPARFIPVAEASGLIVAIGDWVLRGACEQAMAWHRAGLAGAKVAVNLSIRQFQQQDVVAWVAGVLRSTGLPPALLELELTESLIAQDMQRVVEVINRLRALGVSVAIDDFGTGYSSLAYLKHFCVDTLKIDRSFINGMLDDPREATITTAAIQLAHQLGFQVIAEGVELPEQCHMLMVHGCDQVQGFLFSPPVDAAAMEALLRGEGFSLPRQHPPSPALGP